MEVGVLEAYGHVVGLHYSVHLILADLDYFKGVLGGGDALLWQDLLEKEATKVLDRFVALDSEFVHRAAIFDIMGDPDEMLGQKFDLGNR